MDIGDLAAYGSFLVAILSAFYARHAVTVSKRGNKIATHHQLRPLRLNAYNAMKEFAHYCETYSTKLHLRAVEGTRDLVAHIESFEWEIDRLGPLDISQAEEKMHELTQKAWQLQRILDRIAGGQNNPADREYETAEDNKIGLIEWFHAERKGLQTLFEQYLGGA